MNRYLKQLGAYAGIGSMLISTAVHAAPLGGQVTAGSAQISQSGATTTITQQSANASLSWQGFNVSSNETVNFVQPNASSIAVNRILGNSGSLIFGHLNANGQVWLINPNGILFGQGSQINVGGLVASTLDIADSSITSNTRQFKGNGLGSIINQGSITAAPGGYIALLGNQVSNQGYLSAQLGTIALGAGSATTLTFNGNQLLHLQVDESTLNNLAENKQLIQADGGQVIMSAGAKDSILASVVNNTGTVQAQTVENHNGTITLLGGMTAGTTNVDGTLDASAPNGGNGGFIETSAANVKVADTAKVTTFAPNGITGTWLIDPNDYNVAATGGDQSGQNITNNLRSTNVTLLSSSGATSGSGNININDTVSWSANNLTLTAANNINVNAVMTATGNASLNLNPATANGSDTAVLGGAVNMALTSSGFTGRIDYSATGPLNINGTQYTVINSLGSAGSTTGTDLQGIQGNLSGHYVLGSNIDAAATSTWNGGAGFGQLGTFNGVLEGFGHAVSGLSISSPGGDAVGFFNMLNNSARVSNLYMQNANVSGGNYAGVISGLSNGDVRNVIASGLLNGGGTIGGLVGRLETSTSKIANSYSNVDVIASWGTAGGITGSNFGTITNSLSSGSVTGDAALGGLVGYNAPNALILSSSSSSNINHQQFSGNGNKGYGGLVGFNAGTVQNSFASGAVNGFIGVGGLIGMNAGLVVDSYAHGAVSGTQEVGGLVGNNGGPAPFSIWDLTPSANITNSYATGNVNGDSYLGGLVGYNFGNISNSHASGDITSLTAQPGASHTSEFIGGLVGYNYGLVDRTYATGATFGKSMVGGLVGLNDSAVTNSYANGSVVGNGALGGLVGWNTSQGSINDAYATGSVSTGEFIGYSYVAYDTGGSIGGLVGFNNGGSISNAYSTSKVIGLGSNNGGLVGLDHGGTITNTYSTGPVSGFQLNGGLIGGTDGYGDSVTNSYWNTSTSGLSTSAGGVGLTTAQMQQASNFTGFNFTTTPGATGNNWVMVDADGTLNNAGGASGGTLPMLASEYSTKITNAHELQLMAMNSSENYSLANNINAVNTSRNNDIWSSTFIPIHNFSGALQGDSNHISNLTINLPQSEYLGLFANTLYGSSISNLTLDALDIRGYTYVGGLVGANYGSVFNVGVQGNVSGNVGVGTLVGYNFGSVLNSHAEGIVKGVAGTAYGPASYLNVIGGEELGGLVGGNYGLIDSSYSNSHVSKADGYTGYNVGGLAGANQDHGLISNSYSLGSVVGDVWIGGFVGCSCGSLVTILNSYSAASVASSDWSGKGDFVGLMDGGTYQNNHALGSVFFGRVYYDKGMPALQNNSGLNLSQMQQVSNFVGFNFTTTPGASGNNWVMVDVDGSLNNAGGASGGTLPMLASEYSTKITNAHQLQLMAMDLSANYKLSNNINASNTNTSTLLKDVWSTPGGFVPVGYASNVFNGSLDGLDHNVLNLTINTNSNDYVGLFGANGTGSVIQNVNLVDANVLGKSYVGGLSGHNYGIISNSSSAGNVSGTLYIGGLVGVNNGTIVNSHTAGNVLGPDLVGGLAGVNASVINASYSTANIANGGFEAGGLVGQNYSASAIISDSYATGNVTANHIAGGLVGNNYAGSIFNSYATGNVTATIDVAGGLVGLNMCCLISGSYSSGAVNSPLLAGGLVGFNQPLNERDSPGSLLNSFYNIDAVLVNGAHQLTVGGIYSMQYQDWMSHSRSLNISNYASTLAADGNGNYSVTNPQSLRDLLGFSEDPSLHFVQTSNIDLTNSAGLYIPYFAGSFDGQGQVISNLNINMPTTGALGLFGYATSTATIQNVNLTNSTVVGSIGLGGLVGYNYGNIFNSSSSGNISYSNDWNGLIFHGADAPGTYIGGLVGFNKGYIDQSHSSGTVSGNLIIGGLVGQNGGWYTIGSILNSSSSVSVTGNQYVGGLLGYNSVGIVTNSNASGNVVGQYFVGGLIGENVGFMGNGHWSEGGRNDGVITNSFASGDVSGLVNVGGLVGLAISASIINGSYATGSVTGQSYVGGLVGFNSSDCPSCNLSTINNSYSIGNVNGGDSTGGIVGKNTGAIVKSYATGSVIGTGSVGGFVGFNTGSISKSFATGAVVGSGAYIGGLVGQQAGVNEFTGSVSDSYSTGKVTGNAYVGGLVGLNYYGGVISNTYSTGAVTGSFDAADFVGQNDGVITNSYALQNLGNFFAENIGGNPFPGYIFSTSIDANSKVLTANQIMQSSSFGSWNTSNPNTISKVGGTGSVWRIYEGHTNPLLTSFMTDLTLSGAPDLSVVYNGSIQVAGSISPLSGVLGGGASGKNVGFYNGYYSTQLGYNLTGGNITITPKALTVINSAVANKVYDGSNIATVTGGTLVGLVNGDAVALSQSGLFATKNVGTAIAVTATDSLVGNTYGNYILTQPTLSAANITPRVIILTGTRVYDGTTTATAATLSASNLVLGDTLTLTGSVTLAAKNVGAQNITVKTALLLSGNSNYTLTGSTGSVSISPKVLTVTGTKVANKVYNGTTAATLSGGVLAGVVTGDRLTLTQAGNFATKNAGTGIAVTAADTITGTGATNYILTQPTGLTANITPKALTVTGTKVANKVYDGTNTATVTTGALSGLIAGDVVTLTQAGTFASKNAGTNLAVTIADTITGTGASNYTLTQPTGLRASITPRPLVLAGTRLANGSTTVAASVLSATNLIAGDVLTLGGSVTVASALAGTRAITSFTALTLAGASATNYSKTGASGSVILQ